MQTRTTATRVRAGDPGDALHGVAERFSHISGSRAVVRDEIRGSWQRSAEAGIRPDRFVAPFDGEVDGEGLLTWAAAPIIDRVGRDLAGARTGLLLANERAHIVARRSFESDVAMLLDRIDLAPGF